jgi:hypothetical protein
MNGRPVPAAADGRGAVRRRGARAALLGLAALAGCASIPDGPSTMALPGTGRGFAQFRADDDACRRFALERIGGQTAQRSAQDAAAGTAIAGAAIGAIAGAALGGSSGAGIGAGTGLLVGSAAGAGAAASTGYEAQRRYDDAYVQCMYASGHKVPVSSAGFRAAPVAGAPSPRAAPPAPPGVPPPPPAAVPGVPRSAVPLPPPGAPPPPPSGWRRG